MGMRLSMVKISPLPERRQEVLDILLSMKGPTQALGGCLNCGIYLEYGEEPAIVYLEEWRTAAEMYRHMRSSLYGRLLEGMELSQSAPEVCVYEIAATCGLELIEAVRRPEENRAVADDEAREGGA